MKNAQGSWVGKTAAPQFKTYPTAGQLQPAAAAPVVTPPPAAPPVVTPTNNLGNGADVPSALPQSMQDAINAATTGYNPGAAFQTDLGSIQDGIVSPFQGDTSSPDQGRVNLANAMLAATQPQTDPAQAKRSGGTSNSTLRGGVGSLLGRARN